MDKQLSYTLEELAQVTGSALVGDPDYKVTGYADLESAGPDDVSFLSSPRYTKIRYVNAMMQSRAGVIFIAPNAPIPEGKHILVNEDPSKAFQQVIIAMRGGVDKRSAFEGVHPRAVVHESARLATGVKIGPNAVIDEGVVIGDNTTIGAGCFIGPRSTLGQDCVIHPNVSIRENCFLGNRVTIQPGTVIGSCGFGYSTDNQGKHVRLTHVGVVVIEDDVEIGANTVVDRARFTTTRIGRGTKVDNCVVVAHNVKLGEDNLICSQTGIAGSTQTGRHVVIGGQTGIDGHIKLAEGVIIAAKSGVAKSLPAGKYRGVPVQPLEQFQRNTAMLRRIGAYVKDVKDLKDRLEKLENMSK